MKITIDIDMSPEEARKMMGLPDLEPMQQELLASIQAKMQQNIEEMSDPDYFIKRFLPMGIQGAEQFQKFFGEFAKSASAGAKSAGKKSGAD